MIFAAATPRELLLLRIGPMATRVYELWNLGVRWRWDPERYIKHRRTWIDNGGESPEAKS